MNFNLPPTEKRPKENEVINKKRAWDKDLDFELVLVSGETTREDDSRFIEDIRRCVSNKENYLGEGGVGTVYGLGKGSGICIKLIANRHESANAHMMNLGNDVDGEVTFLIDLEGLEVDGVRATRYFCYFKGKEHNAIIMEELNAVNLQDVLLGRAPMPDNFNLDVAFGALEEYIDRMQQEKGIVHNDLEARNLMIDLETGTFRVIDFGRSFYEKDKKEMEKRGKVDWDNLDKIYEKLSQLLDK